MKKTVVALAFIAMLTLAFFTLVDRYPTVDDCVAQVDHYVNRGLFSSLIGVEYRRRCRAADGQDARNEIVKMIDDDASIRASRR